MAGPMNRKFEKAKDSKKAIINALSLCKKYWPAIVFAIILAIASAVLTIIGPDKIGEITNIIGASLKVGADIDMIKVWDITLTMAIIYVSSGLCSFLQDFIMASVTNKIAKKLRSQINEKISKLPLDYFSKNAYGDVLSRITNDVDTISQSLSNTLATLIASVVQFVGCIIMMFITNGIMAITCILSCLVGLVLVFVIMSKSQKYFIERQQYLGELNGYIEEMYSGHNVIRTNNAENKVNSKFEKLNTNVRQSNFKSQFLSGLMGPLMNFVGNFGYVAVCIVGAYLIINGSYGPGLITEFVMYVRLFESPLRQIAQSLTSVQSASAASERVFEFLSEKEMETEQNKNLLPSKINGDLEFKNVKFTYPSNEKPTITNLSFSAKAGQKIAIVGPTGAGKTTIVNLFMRFYEIDSGEILIDGINTKNLTREQVHSIFSMVLQDTWLFEGTLRENLCFNMKNITDEQLDKVCKDCNLTHLVKTLPNGYDTVIDGKSQISQGQKQLITIARAMLQNSPMLILDEATSSIDTRTEILVQNAMDKLSQNRTSIVIAHRLSTIKNADLILVIKDGDIIEQGTHQSLLDSKGFYSELYNSQFNKQD